MNGVAVSVFRFLYVVVVMYICTWMHLLTTLFFCCVYSIVYLFSPGVRYGGKRNNGECQKRETRQSWIILDKVNQRFKSQVKTQQSNQSGENRLFGQLPHSGTSTSIFFSLTAISHSFTHLFFCISLLPELYAVKRYFDTSQ